MKLLIANRGEIALRIIRAARKLGLPSIAVYSEADKTALHVQEADEAYLLGPAPSAESYLNQKKILAIAKQAKAKLIHPGYGFLSENASFAKACEKEKITFIGPSSKTISLLGNKFKAKQLAKKCKVPILSDSSTEIKTIKELHTYCKNIKFPILLKAVDGGGGKGIRIVNKASETESAFKLASSEAQTAFNNPKIYIEPYLKKARHIEIQVIADTKGNIVPLGERECSIQRRFQKLIEETPSPFMTATLRSEMEKAAVALFRASNYVNAGTVEFLVDPKKNFFFLEVNTRLQVEHPITEMVYNIDLVAEQIQIALGKRLSILKKPRAKGHAMELRLCAEDPDNNFYPSTGTIDYLEEPVDKNLRLDSSLFLNMTVTHHYDSLLAKCISWGKTRKEVLQQLKKALSDFHISGIATNIPFFKQLLSHPSFKEGEVDTQFLDQVFTQKEKKEQATPFQAALSALLHHLKKETTTSFKDKETKLTKWQTKNRVHNELQSRNWKKAFSG